jgi:hypothetical protein
MSQDSSSGGQLSEQQVQATQEFINATIAALQNETGVHAETAIAATARMAGTFLFRSFDFALDGLQPGQPVLSEQANEQGPRLVQIIAAMLAHLGETIDFSKAAAGRGPKHQPQLTFIETLGRLEPEYSRIKDRLALSPQTAAEAAAVAAALLIRQCKEVLDVGIGFGLAAYAVVEGTKTAPGDQQ